MPDSSPVSALDLTHTHPRSPSMRLLGIAHLPRMLDKARARAAGHLGEYTYPCPMDAQVLAFLELSADVVADAAVHRDDTRMEGWIATHGAARTDAEKNTFSADLLSQGMHDEDTRQYFVDLRDEVAPGRDDITSFAALIDLEEGHIS